MQKEPSYGKEHFWSALTWCLSGKKVHTIFPFKKYTSAYITICRITFFHFSPLEHIILFGHNQWNEIISNQMEHDPIYQIQSHVKNIHRGLIRDRIRLSDIHHPIRQLDQIVSHC